MAAALVAALLIGGNVLPSAAQEPPPIATEFLTGRAAFTDDGMPLGEVARRMRHSVDTLVPTYVGAPTGDEDLANRRVDALLTGGQICPR